MSESAPEGTGPEEGQEPDEQGNPATGGEEEGQGQEPTGTAGELDPAELQRQIAHWKTQARKHEQRARANQKGASEWEKLQESQKTEIQRAQEAQAAAERERDAAIAQHNRVVAAASNDLDPDLIEFLGEGSDEEIGERAETLGRVIREQAEQLAEQLAEKLVAERLEGQPRGGGVRGTVDSRPVESMRAGGAPANGGKPQDKNSWFRELVEQRRS